MSVLYYLNDVEEGGETAFPIADTCAKRYEVIFILFPLSASIDNNCRDYKSFRYVSRRSYKVSPCIDIVKYMEKQ